MLVLLLSLLYFGNQNTQNYLFFFGKCYVLGLTSARIQSHWTILRSRLHHVNSQHTVVGLQAQHLVWRITLLLIASHDWINSQIFYYFPWKKHCQYILIEHSLYLWYNSFYTLNFLQTVTSTYDWVSIRNSISVSFDPKFWNDWKMLLEASPCWTTVLVLSMLQSMLLHGELTIAASPCRTINST